MFVPKAHIKYFVERSLIIFDEIEPGILRDISLDVEMFDILLYAERNFPHPNRIRSDR